MCLVNTVLGLHVEREATLYCAQFHHFFLVWIQFKFHHFIIWFVAINGKTVERERDLLIECILTRFVFVNDEDAALVLQHVLVYAVGSLLLLST